MQARGEKTAEAKDKGDDPTLEQSVRVPQKQELVCSRCRKAMYIAKREERKRKDQRKEKFDKMAKHTMPLAKLYDAWGNHVANATV